MNEQFKCGSWFWYQLTSIDIHFKPPTTSDWHVSRYAIVGERDHRHIKTLHSWAYRYSVSSFRAILIGGEIHLAAPTRELNHLKELQQHFSRITTVSHCIMCQYYVWCLRMIRWKNRCRCKCDFGWVFGASYKRLYDECNHRFIDSPSHHSFVNSVESTRLVVLSNKLKNSCGLV